LPNNATAQYTMSLVEPSELNSIATRVQACLESFHDVYGRLQSAELSIREKLPLSVMHDLLGRFRLWVGNIGAHRRGRGSLDYKLREASHIRNRVIDLLQNLELVLHEILEIITGERVPWEDLSDSDSDFSESLSQSSEEDLPSELAQLASNIAEVNTCLMRLSLAIRNPAPHDQFKESAQIDVAHFEPFDINHVRGKFKLAPEYLVLRLGKAISRRRQYLRYREDHRRKLEQGLGLHPVLQEPSKAPSEKMQSTVASSIPTAVKAAASGLDWDQDDYYGETLSQTSYASSHSDPSRLKPPPLPRTAQDSEPFECTLCYRFTSIRQTNAWHKHVFRDLQPYMCTFDDCHTPDRTYESRHEWFQHELHAHRKWWECIVGCNATFTSLHAFNKHLGQEHSELAGAVRIEDLVRTCARQIPLENEAECNLCRERLSSLTELRRHLGKHQEELSLFALPLRVQDDDSEHQEDEFEDRSISGDAGRSLLLSGELQPLSDADIEPVSPILSAFTGSSSEFVVPDVIQLDLPPRNSALDEIADMDQSPVMSRPSAVHKEAYSVKIENLSLECTSSHIHSLLLTVGQPIDWKMLPNLHTGLFKGRATGTFATEDEAHRAADLLDGIEHLGMKLRVWVDTIYPDRSIKASEHLRNPADNPPCNTLWIGNLPMDTSEDELKDVFSKQTGYKRLCFRTKEDGPMCLVEFEDIFSASSARYGLHGYMLHNSVDGGIRLSFSKSPLGVRSGQDSSMSPASAGVSVSDSLSPLLSPASAIFAQSPHSQLLREPPLSMESLDSDKDGSHGDRVGELAMAPSSPGLSHVYEQARPTAENHQPGSYFEVTGGDWVPRRSKSGTLSDGSGRSMSSPTSRLCYKSLSGTVLM
jgi:hypothetical protein